MNLARIDCGFAVRLLPGFVGSRLFVCPYSAAGRAALFCRTLNLDPIWKRRDSILAET